MKLLVQEFLMNHSFSDLEKEHGVYVSVSKNNRKISLNYDHIETKESDVLSWDCRGLILSKIDFSEFNMLPDNKIDKNIIIGDTQIIAFGLRRFFNYGQGSTNINWNDSSLQIVEKLDGTLCILHMDPFTKKWNVATRSVAEADLLMDNGIFTFRTLFEKALKDTCGQTFEEYTSKLDSKITYCFELTTPYNQIVVNYPDNRITLLAVRNILSLDELDISKIETYGVPIIQSYKYNSINDLLSWVSSRNPMKYEGVVVKDSNFNRVKIKNAGYVAFNRIKDSVSKSPRTCLELILSEKEDDAISFLPEEIVKNLLKLKSNVQNLIKEHDQIYNSISHIEDKKSFALKLQELAKEKNIWVTPLFQIFNKKAVNMHDFINKNKTLSGSWHNSFLDKILEFI